MWKYLGRPVLWGDETKWELSEILFHYIMNIMKRYSIAVFRFVLILLIDLQLVINHQISTNNQVVFESVAISP